jgi:hypothetical protein
MVDACKNFNAAARMGALAIGLSLGACATAWAGLGGPPTQLGAAATTSTASKAPDGQSAYTEIDKQLDSGTLVREYVDASGTVFAVSWSGPFPPDLKEILGPYFDTLVAHGKRPGGGRSPLVVEQGGVVIVSGGHMGALQGKAWLPAKLPAGFNPGDIK